MKKKSRCLYRELETDLQSNSTSFQCPVVLLLEDSLLGIELEEDERLGLEDDLDEVEDAKEEEVSVAVDDDDDEDEEVDERSDVVAITCYITSPVQAS